ncbi:MAG: NAD(P)H-dependent flavin oxidoreductase [Paracoccaceae bacterium]
MWPSTRLTDLLGIEHPIILAPMAATTTPALVAAVSGAGGLGSHGCAVMSAEALASDMAELRARTNAPVNLNFFCHTKHPMDAGHHDALMVELGPDYAQAGAAAPSGPPEGAPFTPFGEDQLELLLAHPPAVVSFHFGLPPIEMMEALKQAGCLILSSATTVAEARWLEARGVDAIIAQGWEAGGHRGVFLDVAQDAQVGLFALLPQVVDGVSVPVIAAGGIADGRGIAAAFALGADGVQVGTAFITSDEAADRDIHRAAVATGHDGSTLVTTAGSGRPARGHRTDWLSRMEGVDTAPFPLMYHYSRPLQGADSEQYQFSLYGQSAALAPTGSAAERLQSLVEDAQTALAALRCT